VPGGVVLGGREALWGGGLRNASYESGEWRCRESLPFHLKGQAFC
jgi:hypothetical protein